MVINAQEKKARKLELVRPDVSLFLQMRPFRPRVVNNLPKVTQLVRGRIRPLARWSFCNAVLLP